MRYINWHWHWYCSGEIFKLNHLVAQVETSSPWISRLLRETVSDMLARRLRSARRAPERRTRLLAHPNRYIPITHRQPLSLFYAWLSALHIRSSVFVSVTVYIIVSALPFRSIVAVALTVRKRKNWTRSYLNEWTETANLWKRRT